MEQLSSFNWRDIDIDFILRNTIHDHVFHLSLVATLGVEEAWMVLLCELASCVLCYGIWLHQVSFCVDLLDQAVLRVTEWIALADEAWRLGRC